MRNSFGRKIGKYLLFLVFICTVDFFGLFLHFFEWEYDRFLHYPESDGAIWYAHKESLNDNELPIINNFNYTFIHNASHKCIKKDPPPHIIFLIKSAVGNFQRRSTIRRTWGYENRFLNVTMSRVFLLGVGPLELMHRVNMEATQNGDIVQANFVDAYFNNTIKIVLGMRWAKQNSQNSQYFMFVDDDYYVSLKNILRFIANPINYPEVSGDGMKNMHSEKKSHSFIDSPNKEAVAKMFAGYVVQSAPHRHKSSKWFVSLQEYPFDKWPPYVTAGAFILSRDALSEIYNSSQNMRQFRFDDIFLGIAALKAGLFLTHCPMFFFHKPTYSSPESYRNVIASHGFDNPVDLARIWNECRSAGYA